MVTTQHRPTWINFKYELPQYYSHLHTLLYEWWNMYWTGNMLLYFSLERTNLWARYQPRTNLYSKSTHTTGAFIIISLYPSTTLFFSAICDTGFCMNGGTCIRHNFCLCPDGWSGSRCNIRKPWPTSCNHWQLLTPNTIHCSHLFLFLSTWKLYWT